MQKFDVIFIGGGPAGYVGALYASRMGLSVLVIEENNVGGTCLNKGCIPTKSLLVISHEIDDFKKLKNSGIFLSDTTINFSKILKRKDDIVLKLRAGIESLFKLRKIALFRERGVIVSKNEVRAGSEILEAKNIIIATGSKPKALRELGNLCEIVISSDELVNINLLPKNLLIVGGGAIGCEYADMFSGFGTKVTLIEIADSLLPNMDKEFGVKLELILKKKGVEIYTKTKVGEAIISDGKAMIKLSNGKASEVDKILVSVGRVPNISGIGLEEVGIKLEKGAILVDKYLKTNVENIFAVGDVIGGMMLAHVASHEAILAVSNILGKNKAMDYGVIPNCIYTEPEIASIGIGEDEAKTNPNLRISKFPLTALGKAHAISKSEGFVKIISEIDSKKIRGIHIMSHNASDLISEGAIIIKNNLTLSDLKETMHPHPTLSEAIMEAAFMALGEGIHTL